MPRLDDDNRVWVDFCSLNNWRRSSKGNLWREWKGAALTIFTRKDDLCGWCIAGEDGPQYSDAAYDSEEDTIEELFYEVDITLTDEGEE